MPDHLIRLRRAWELRDESSTRRVDLPCPGWPAEAGPFWLDRGFRKPPIDPDRERLLLRVGLVPGLLIVSLNGERLNFPLVLDGAEMETGLPAGLPERNVLALRVDPRGLDGGAWGEIALVIRRS